ncbi:MAG: anion permease, partial [Casimicrobiaceae bacterium]
GVRPSRGDRWVRPGQLASCAFTALGHGGNDAQKVVAVIWLAITAAGVAGVNASTLPGWVPYGAAASLALGCALGGVRLISGKGEKIARLRPADGWSAESAAGLALAAACAVGTPVSSTHVIMAGVLGADAVRADRAFRRNIRGVILWAWAVTAPAAGMLAALASLLWSSAR